MKSKINKKAMTYLGILCLTCPVFYYLSIRSGGAVGRLHISDRAYVDAGVCRGMYEAFVRSFHKRDRVENKRLAADRDRVCPAAGELYCRIWTDMAYGDGRLSARGDHAVSDHGNPGAVWKHDNGGRGRNRLAGIFADGTAPDAGLQTVKLGHRDHMVRLSYAADRFLWSIRGIRGISLPNLASVLPCATRRRLPLSGAGMRNAIFLVKCSK